MAKQNDNLHTNEGATIDSFIYLFLMVTSPKNFHPKDEHKMKQVANIWSLLSSFLHLQDGRNVLLYCIIGQANVAQWGTLTHLKTICI